MNYFFIKDEYKSLLRKRNELMSKLKYYDDFSPAIPELQWISYSLRQKRNERMSRKIEYYNQLIANAKVFGNEIILLHSYINKPKIGLWSKVVLQMNNILVPFIIWWYISFKNRLSYASKLGALLMWHTRWSSVYIYNGDYRYEIHIISIS
jgi:hypothetical protein